MGATYGIVGWPVEHSRSPAMHNAAFRARGLDASYVCFSVHPDDVEIAVRGLYALGVRGANVTVPHKETVLKLLDQVSPEARAIGAVNTLVRESHGFLGHNTDAEGLARSLDEAGVALQDTQVVVLGAGGAARASVVGLAARGAERITVAARRPEQAEALARSVAPCMGDCSLEVERLSRDALIAPLRDADLLVQSTSATLAHPEVAEAFADALPLEVMRSGAAVLDLVYKPRETAVLIRAKQLGLRTIDGLGMLLHQGALAFELWTHTAAPLEVMRLALDE